MPLRRLHFLALVLTALALAPGGAHLFALPAKLALDQQAYFTVQSIYRGWAWLGVFTVAAPIAALVLAYRRWRLHTGYVRILLAGLLLVAVLIVFFGWTFPANQATQNWTVAPADWAALRARWEWSHAVNAVLTFLAFCLLLLTALPRR
jgi:hypothetical protein